MTVLDMLLQADRWIHSLVLVLLLTALLALGAQPRQVAAPTWLAGPGPKPAASGWPLVFVPNAGQTHPAVRFQVNSMGGTVFFTPQEMVMSLPASTVRSELAALRQGTGLAAAPTVVRVRFEGANPAPEITGVDRLPGSVNYFIGNNPERWHTRLATYASVVYHELYPGIDLRYDGEGGTLKGTYVVAPGADPALIQLAFEDVGSLEIDERGNLVLRVPTGEIRQARPYVYQEVKGEQKAVPAQYVLDKRLVRFQVAAYDASLPLIVDPQVDYATFLGGDGEDGASGVAVDASGNVYVTGNTYSSDFPTQNPLPQPGGRRDAFVTKLSADGRSLIYSTYLGGDRGELGTAIAIDSSGNAYVAGYTSSTDFPTTAPTQSSLSGDVDAFITQLNASGSSLLFSTYLGGTSLEYAQSIAVGGVGNVYVAGYTSSSDFPTVNPQQPTFQTGGNDAFVARLNSSTPSVLYATYLGGDQDDRAHGIACDGSGNAYVVGETRSSNFPTTASAFQTTGGGSWFDAFVTSFDSTGSAHRYSTYLGGSDDDDRAYAVTVDALGNAHVTGHTESQYFPTTPGAYDTTYNGELFYNDDAFIAKIEPGGSALVFSTYFGGAEMDWGKAIALDQYGNVYVAGDTWSTDLPTKDAFQATPGGGTADAFVAQFDPLGSDLAYASYLGGGADDWATAIAVDGQRRVYVVGITESSDFPTVNPFDASYGNNGDGFVTRLAASSLATTGVIPPSGGRLSSLDGKASFAFPNGAFTQSVHVTYAPLARPGETGDRLDVGCAYELTAVYSDTGQVAHIAPGASYSVVITYTSSGAAIEDSLALYYWDGSQWVVESSSELDMAAKTVSAAPGHLSKWAVLGQTHRLYLPFVVRAG